ncbi:MAG TPA: nucleotidyl transferase AbiEii/AbiGii toxin family protein [Flavobacteriales bacterium]|nr:nucleotidyl transferase AbiEii/AbiGii toxin family protein [Flavobacteriales bacterium]HRJ35817.1 nucleotidyl transferase AbiEii/AbiGii toxin family protein [Flavobacteriales bacterium]HRJ37173.1 nucleotidyl transferase AbiEii/AbiGii toxin family protein [Flavobacteriales bacterium]
MSEYLHDHKNFPDLILILAEEKGIDPGLVEKDYWIMHVLYGLSKNGFQFELKGGTSLSKGYKLIHRFSEDIDIHICPPASFKINENPKNSNKNNAEKRKNFFDWLAQEISIPGIINSKRDPVFDDLELYRSGGIRLQYNTTFGQIEGIKEGILLEVGFDTVAPNERLTISSWAIEKALENKVEIIDNRATGIPCYDPRYTFVEKLQTIATKFRNEQDTGKKGMNFMRQYYDVFCLLGEPMIIDFIGSNEYQNHKRIRFPDADYEIPIHKNEAFILSSPLQKSDFEKRYSSTASLYYQNQPSLDEILERIALHAHRL